MWPWGHLAVGYLVYAGITWYRTRRVPGDVPALAVALGTQAPDLVDKPLGWYLGVLPGGRALAHSLFALAVVCGLAASVGLHRGRRAPLLAFVVGYATHLVGDAVGPFVTGDYAELAFLLWPVLPLPESDFAGGALAALAAEDYSTRFFVEVGVTVAAVGLWRHQGYPGLGSVRGWIRRRVVVG